MRLSARAAVAEWAVLESTPLMAASNPLSSLEESEGELSLWPLWESEESESEAGRLEEEEEDL